MANAPALIDQHGAPLRAGRKASAYEASSGRSQELAAWNPFNYSADGALFRERDTMVARIHDVARNDGWAASALSKHVDTAIGAMFSLQAEPDWQALGLDKEWADEWSQHVEGRWRAYAEDPDFWSDAAQQRPMVGLFGQMYRHKLADGDSLSLSLWLPDRGGEWATTVQVIDPDRLSNPQEQSDSEFLRGGIALGPHGEALAYHFRKGHPGDLFGLLGVSGRHFEWERVERNTPFGRRLVVHDFEADRAGQTRGVSKFAPILKKMRMLWRYDESELAAAVINAIFAAFIETPFDQEAFATALQTDDLGKYEAGREAFHEDSRLKLNGSRIPFLYPGEHMNMTQPTRPAQAYAPFTEAAIRNIASAVDLSYEQLSMDFSKTNYSSVRAALNEVWKHFNAGRGRFAEQTARPHYANWLEEDIDRGGTELPPGAPSFEEAKAAYTRCRWNGPGRGYVDQVREAQGALLRMEIGISTLQRECREQGLDWREVIAQRRREIAFMEEMGVPKPEWAVMQAVGQGPANEEQQGSAT